MVSQEFLGGELILDIKEQWKPGEEKMNNASNKFMQLLTYIISLGHCKHFMIDIIFRAYFVKTKLRPNEIKSPALSHITKEKKEEKKAELEFEA
jgi:hypothetical protein